MNDNKLKKLSFQTILYIILFILGTPQLIYRFNNPQMTETELFINFFKAYGL